MSSHWDDQAACKGMDTELWFSETDWCVTKAKDICAGCPVAERCREEAVSNRLRGVWGGTNEYDRERIRRSRRVPDPSKRKTHCQNNHEFTPENTYLRPNGERQCKECARARKRAKAALRPPRVPSTHCNRNHEWTPETTYLDPNGTRVCRVCRALTARARRARSAA